MCVNFPKLDPKQLKYGSAIVGCVAPKLQIESVFECTTPTLLIHTITSMFSKLLPVFIV
jgi:hypothetical protein